MKKHTVISARNVSKLYHFYAHPRDRVKQALFGFLDKGYSREFQALKDISFDVSRGESVGIIGRNGAGKSTLLQIISGILKPSAGKMEVNGKIGTLLELGAGFNPEFSGRENVYISGKLMGLSHRGIDARFDEIAEFADIGEFIEHPIKAYSDGMVMRLAFAIQTAIEPDILVVDEVLSVGDIFFRQKCFKRMMELRENGVTILFVSHDMAVVRDLCEKGVYLKKGSIKYSGFSQKAIHMYFGEKSGISRSGEIPAKIPLNIMTADSEVRFRNEAVWAREAARGDENLKARILAVSVLNSDEEAVMTAHIGEEITFKVLYQTFVQSGVNVSLVMKNRMNQTVFNSGSYHKRIPSPSLHPNQRAIFEFKVTCMIEAGAYTFCMILGEDNANRLPNRGIIIDETPWIGPFEIKWDYEIQKAPFVGMFGLPSSGRFISIQG